MSAIDRQFTATLQKSPAKGGWTYVQWAEEELATADREREEAIDRRDLAPHLVPRVEGALGDALGAALHDLRVRRDEYRLLLRHEEEILRPLIVVGDRHVRPLVLVVLFFGALGRRLLLHFGAVDYAARVWLNGNEPTDGLSTPVGPSDEVAVLPPVSGG